MNLPRGCAMFGFFSRKKQQEQTSLSPDVFLNELVNQDISQEVISNVAFYDVDFEKVVPLLDSDSNIWHKLELQYLPDVHQSKMDCLKYVTVKNSKYICEIYKNRAGLNVCVNIIDLKLLLDFQNIVIKACKDALDSDTNTFIEVPVIDIEEYLELIVFYEDFYKRSSNAEVILELFKHYDLYNNLDILLKVFAKNNGITTIDNTFQIIRHTHTNAKVTVYKEAIPITYTKKVNTYKMYGTGWKDFIINYKKLAIEE